MKRMIFSLIGLVMIINALAGEREHLTVNAGYLYPNTLNANVGIELETENGHAYEFFGELGDHWRTPVCHNFWKGYYWDGGAQYKHQLKRLKNGAFRVFGGAHCGAEQTHVFFGIRAGFEYYYVFKNNWQFSITQLNTVNFLKGDLFRNGLMIGVKIPL